MCLLSVNPHTDSLEGLHSEAASHHRRAPKITYSILAVEHMHLSSTVSPA